MSTALMKRFLPRHEFGAQLKADPAAFKIRQIEELEPCNHEKAYLFYVEKCRTYSTRTSSRGTKASSKVWFWG